jgi:Na+/melibiose symporter-like transporter
LLRFVQLVPYLGLALLFGVWLDRVRKRPVMIWANVVRMVLIAAIPVLYWADMLTMTYVLVISLLVGIASVAFDLSWMSLIPVLVKDSKHYVEASSKMGMSSSSADVVGQPLGGALVSLLTAPVALIADAFSYLVSVVSLCLITVEEPAPKPATERRHVLHELVDGLKFVFRHPILRPLALVAPFCNACLVMVQTLFIIYAAKELQLSAAMIGAVIGIGAVGGLIGSALAPRVIKRFTVGRCYAVSMAGIFLAPSIIPAAGGPRWLQLGLFGLSFLISLASLGVAGVVMFSLRQTCTPQSLMGRMSAAFRTLLFGGGALGGLFGGILAGGMGAKQALVYAAIGSAVVVIGLIISPVSRLKELPPAAQEPQPAETSA